MKLRRTKSLRNFLRKLPYYPGQASMDAHSSSTKKLRMDGCTEEMLEWFGYPWASAHPGCEVSCQRVPHRCFTCALSRPAWQWRKLYHARKWTDQPLPSFFNVRYLQYANLVLQAKNTVNEATDRCVQTFTSRFYGVWNASEWSKLCTWGQWTYLLGMCNVHMNETFCIFHRTLLLLRKKPFSLQKNSSNLWQSSTTNYAHTCTKKCFGEVAKYDMLKDPQAQNGIYKITMCDSPSKN